MWAAVIRTINNLLRIAWLRTWTLRNGDRAGVSRCSEGDHEGRIREVPQEERSPSMYIAQNVHCRKEEFQLYYKYCWKTNIQDLHCLHCWCVYVYFLMPAKSPLFFSRIQTCPTITGVYFSQVKNKQWIPWVYTWSWHCRKHIQCPIF
jgi:hypothetical protein